MIETKLRSVTMFENVNLKVLDVIDTLSERHGAMRNIVESKANQMNDINVNSSEWYIMAMLYNQTLTFSEIAHKVNLTRQAIHKSVKQLEKKELVIIGSMTNNKKEKCVTLTSYGSACFDSYISCKQTLEQHIESIIGTEQFQIFKTILQQDWHLTEFKSKNEI